MKHSMSPQMLASLSENPQLALTDQELSTKAREKLRASGHSSLMGVECEIESRVLELRGSVASYYLKQLAQTVVLQMAPELKVRNSIRVVGGAAD